ncbi:MAG: TRL-like family protein [Candidatus Magnetoovum sp. WYHC-5]|nr:TRL-like family protein [Candidatus Magnetoovum sp. WYHC-5]
MLKKVFLIIILSVMVSVVSSCGFVADGPFGWIYTDYKSPVGMGTAKSGSKEGRTCIHSFLGAISVGDASIESAMKAAGIQEIYTINKENLSIFGTYTRQCTLVAGQ